MLAVCLGAVDRSLLHLRDSAGWLCEPSSASRLETGQKTIVFDAAEPCRTAGVALVAGTTCRFDATVRSDRMDGDSPVGPDGLVGPTPLAMRIGTPFR